MNRHTLSVLSDNLLSMTDWNNKEEVLKKLEYQAYYLEYASEELKSDREFILSAVKKNGSALEYASKELKSDREVVLAAVKQDGYGYLGL